SSIAWTVGTFTAPRAARASEASTWGTAPKGARGMGHPPDKRERRRFLCHRTGLTSALVFLVGRATAVALLCPIRFVPLATALWALGCTAPKASAAGSGVTEPVRSRSPPPAVVHDPRDVEALLAQMTLAEKIGQMTQVDRRYIKSDDDVTTLA